MNEKDRMVSILENIDKKLSLITGELIKKRDIKINEQVAILAQVNLDYKEIAQILGITASHAANELSKIRKGGKNGKNRKTASN